MSTSTQNQTPTPAERAKSEFNSLRSDWSSASQRGTLSGMASEIESLGREIGALEATLKDLRQRGYVFGRGWEERVVTLVKAWPGQRAAAERTINAQAAILRNSAREVDQIMSRASFNPLALLPEAKRKVESFESETSRVESMVRGAFSQAKDQESDLSEELYAAKFAVETLEGACFKLNPAENVYMVCKAQWLVDKEDPEGFFYLTDQRVIFEQKEEVATKKVLFIATKKELVQKQLWAIPVGAVEDIKSEDKGGLLGIGAKELLQLKFADAPHDMPLNVTVHVKGGATNEVWSKALMLVKGGQVDSERYETAGGSAAGAAAVEAKQTVTAPTVCPACSGQLPPAYKGMTHLVCPYCGSTTPIG